MEQLAKICTISFFPIKCEIAGEWRIGGMIFHWIQKNQYRFKSKALEFPLNIKACSTVLVIMIENYQIKKAFPELLSLTAAVMHYILKKSI